MQNAECRPTHQVSRLTFHDSLCFLCASRCFFQAEDGMRDLQGDWSSDVCSSDLIVKSAAYAKFDETVEIAVRLGVDPRHADQVRSEERRVGKEGRSRWSPDH